MRTTFYPAICLLGLTLIMALAACGKEKQAPPRAAPEVVVHAVTPKTIPVVVDFVAQAESSHQVNIVARVTGFLDKILYREGDVVTAGQVMFLMDQKPFLAQVAAAKGEVENREAQLWTAKSNLDRIKPLAEQDAASKSDLDNAVGAVKSAEAALHEAKARLDKAELDLSYTTIKSPVTGVSSRSLAREGAYLTPIGSSSQLTYVAQLDPIWINFSVSQNEISAVRADVAKGLLIWPAGDRFEVELELSDGTKYPQRGKLIFGDPSFSQETGTFLVRAEVPNPKAVLRPGMFVKARLHGASRPKAIVVPQKAVQQTANGHVVFVVSDKGTAEVRPVMVGDWVGQDWHIRQGLKGGDRVIVEGFQRIVPGLPVKIVEAGAADKKADAAVTDQKAGDPVKTDKAAPSAPRKK